MDSYEKWGYSLLAIIAIIYLIAMFIGMIAAFPLEFWGLFSCWCGHFDDQGAEGKASQQRG